MKIISRYLSTFLLGSVLGTFIAVAINVVAEREKSSTETIPFEELRTFTEVFHKIKSNYVEEVEDKVLLENAIQGMLTGLDPHSSYLNADEFEELQVGTKGEFGGLGIEVGMEDGFVKVISPIDDTPAQRAGIKAGDLIVRLGDKPVKGMTLMDAVKVMRGEPGSAIKLTIVRKSESKPIVIEIVRDIIKVQSVKSRTLESGYVYIRISNFQTRTEEDLDKAIKTLKEENSDGIKGLVLDLRNNPGGVLNGAVAVSDVFLEDGLIVYTEGRIEDSNYKFKARPDDAFKGSPMVVLVNEGSASASEIVAGALQDHKRAVIMGSKTFGKGSVQTIMQLNGNAALKLTTARYYTPSGRSIQAEGIKPDIELKNLKLAEAEEESEFSYKESDLTGHLNNDNADGTETETEGTETETKKGSPVESNFSDKKDDEKKTKDSEKEGSKEGEEDQEKEESLEKTDYAVHEALNLLKGLNIIKSHSR
jgi:carboxyl-terminal processing protease